jgi:soluble lytic murein transglycosylase
MIIFSVVLALTLAAEDPRIDLVRFQLAGDSQAALAQIEFLIQDQPIWAQAAGLAYLQGDLLDRQGRTDEAARAFAAALSATPILEPFSRLRIAEQQEPQHPEVAAGLVATILAKGAPRSLTPKAISLLRRTLDRGGDCALLRGIDPDRFAQPDRRQLLLAYGACALRRGDRDGALALFVSLLQESQGDEAARQAVEWVAEIGGANLAPETLLLAGMTLYQHREFPRSNLLLEEALAGLRRAGRALPSQQEFDVRYAIARGHFWLDHFALAANRFQQLAGSTSVPRAKAQALYQAGRALELQGEWQRAADIFRTAFNADPTGRWADAALIGALRLEWRTGNEKTALQLFELLRSKSRWKMVAAQAAIFLASSELAQGRADRAPAWLYVAEGGGKAFAYETDYWRGRALELAGDPAGALDRYLRLLRRDIHHPLSQAALTRIRGTSLAPLAIAEGRRRATSERTTDLLDAWRLLGDRDSQGIRARLSLLRQLARERPTVPFLEMAPVPVEAWPLWQASPRQPEELLLALGLFQEGALVVRRFFPLQQPSLALTSSQLLRGAGEATHSLRIAEILSQRVPNSVPLELLPRSYQELLYPDAYGEWVTRQSLRFGVEPALLLGIIREESRFNPTALSDASARGLSQFVMPTARALAGKLDLGPLTPSDLYDPPVSITLGAAYLGQLFENFGGARLPVVASYNAGEPQARLWQRHCFSQEPEEYLSKVGFSQTREYLRKVLTSYSRYLELYGPGLDGGSATSAGR